MSKPVPPTANGSLPEVRQVLPGDILLLCSCGHSPLLPDCPSACPGALRMEVKRPQHLLLCCCGKSTRLPYCDGSHQPEAIGLKDKWRRFIGLD